MAGLSLSKNFADISESELKWLTAQRLSDMTDVIQSYVDNTLVLKQSVESMLKEMESMRAEMAEFRRGKPTIPINAVDTFKYGMQKIIVKKDNGEACIRCLYAIKANGSCLAWQNKKTADPPEDGDLVEWSKDRWILINNKNEQGSKK